MPESVLEDIVRLRIRRIGERTVMIQHLRDFSAAEELGLTALEVEMILRCLQRRKLTTLGFDGCAIWESEFRAWRSLGLEDVLWNG